METVRIPKEPLVEHVVERMKEVGTVENQPTIRPGRGRGPKIDVDWSYSDVNWDVEPTENGFKLIGFTEGGYAVKTLSARYNPPGKAHPAEYDTRSCEVAVEIDVDMENPPVGVWDYTLDARVI